MLVPFTKKLSCLLFLSIFERFFLFTIIYVLYLSKMRSGSVSFNFQPYFYKSFRNTVHQAFEYKSALNKRFPLCYSLDTTLTWTRRTTECRTGRWSTTPRRSRTTRTSGRLGPGNSLLSWRRETARNRVTSMQHLKGTSIEISHLFRWLICPL